MAAITLQNLIRQYGKTTILHGIDLAIEDGQFAVLVGPSGCGKSTTLRLIAGLDEPDGGTVQIGTRQVNGLGPAERDIAMVFQNYALYPHMSVRRNLAFGLENLRLQAAEIDKRVSEAAAMLELQALLDRKPAQLSGGQRQRVAMGRAMVRQPQVYLFDEPLSNLDAQLRATMRLEIKQLHQRSGQTVVYVTHDQVEAMTLADIIVVMRAGRIEQKGTPADLFNHPANTFVASFIGSPRMNLLPAKRVDSGFVVGKGALHIPLKAAPMAAQNLATLTLGLRPDDIQPASLAASHWPRFEARSHFVEPMGTETVITLDLGDQRLGARLRGRTIPAVGDMLPLALDPEGLCWFNAENGQSLGKPQA